MIARLTLPGIARAAIASAIVCGLASTGFSGLWHVDAPPTPYQRMQRAGMPTCLSRWAHPTDDEADCGYYVGGGAARKGEINCPHEGTWGWDYAPWYSRVDLGWWHGRRNQGGIGQYEPDRRNHPFAFDPLP